MKMINLAEYEIAALKLPSILWFDYNRFDWLDRPVDLKVVNNFSTASINTIIIYFNKFLKSNLNRFIYSKFQLRKELLTSFYLFILMTHLYKSSHELILC